MMTLAVLGLGRMSWIGRLNRITGEALIHFLTDPMYEFHGRCHRAELLFEKPYAQ